MESKCGAVQVLVFIGDLPGTTNAPRNCQRQSYIARRRFQTQPTTQPCCCCPCITMHHLCITMPSAAAHAPPPLGPTHDYVSPAGTMIEARTVLAAHAALIHQMTHPRQPHDHGSPHSPICCLTIHRLTCASPMIMAAAARCTQPIRSADPPLVATGVAGASRLPVLHSDASRMTSSMEPFSEPSTAQASRRCLFEGQQHTDARKHCLTRASSTH